MYCYQHPDESLDQRADAVPSPPKGVVRRAFIMCHMCFVDCHSISTAANPFLFKPVYPKEEPVVVPYMYGTGTWPKIPKQMLDLNSKTVGMTPELLKAIEAELDSLIPRQTGFGVAGHWVKPARTPALVHIIEAHVESVLSLHLASMRLFISREMQGVVQKIKDHQSTNNKTE